MPILMKLLFILQLCIISVAPAYASQSFSLATTKASNKAATDELLEAVQRKEKSSDEIIALINKGTEVNTKIFMVISLVFTQKAKVYIRLIHKGIPT